MHQFEQYLALKTIINSNCVLINQAKCFANIALFDPVITLSGPIIPILQVKKKKLKLSWDKELSKDSCFLLRLG